MRARLEYFEVIELEGDDEPDAGTWHLCTHCDGCWRPGDPRVDEDGCPVTEVMRLRAELDELKNPCGERS